MQNRRFLIVIMCCVFLFGSVEVFSQTQQNVSKTPEPVDLKKEVQDTINKVEEKKFSYYYNPAGKRDPFKSPIDEIAEQATVAETGEILEGLRKFNIGTLKLTGILSLSSGNVAVIKAPDGKSYALKRDSKVGANGVVKEIQKDRVIIEDSYKIEEKDYMGKITSKTVSNKIILSLQQKE